MTNEELNELLVEGIEQGRWIGLLTEALPVEDVRRLLVSGEADD